MKILLSIKPEYIKKILDGTKKYEYRKRLATKKIEAIIMYSTESGCKIVGEVKVNGTRSGSPTALWESTKSDSGICRQKYREYFHGRTMAHAYILGEVIIYDIPKTLSDYGLKHPPQSFAYIGDK